MKEFNFDVPNDMIDDSLYQPEYQSLPYISWHGRSNTSNADSGGFFAIQISALDGQEPGPKGYWNVQDIRFGSDPNSPKEACYVTQRLRGVPIGVRKRQIITEETTKREYYFPWMTKKENRLDSAGQLIDGKYGAHYQVMMMIPNIEQPLILALRGYTKTRCWDNEPKSQYGDNKFPRGVEPTLKQIATDASKAKKTKIPWLCFWVIDLCPTFTNNEPLWVDVGHGTFMNPFIVDMITGKEGYPSTRFVGSDNFIKFQNTRRETVRDWEAEWVSAESLASAADAAYDYDDSQSDEVKEDDVIPF